MKENVEIMYPAKYSKYIGGGALDKKGDIWKGTTTGEELDFLLPGQAILSYALNGDYLVASGTSMASAYMAGFLALFIEHNNDVSKGNLYKKILNTKKELDQ